MNVTTTNSQGAGRAVLTKRATCRACGTASLTAVLELGMQPLANRFLTSLDEADVEPRYPLDVYFCTTCSLVQLADVIDPEVLFSHYIYVTGTSTTIAEHNRRYARAVVDELSLGASDLVVEVASNDGSLLACFRDLGVRILGVGPARNIADTANARNIPTENRFFGREAGGLLRSRHGAARAVIGNNVLAHVDDTQGFLAGMADLLGDSGGCAITEVPYAGEMLSRVEYDTVYHEHLCYFSLTALGRLAEHAGMGIVRADDVPVHGGSVRVWFRRGAIHSPEVKRRMAEEQSNGLATLAAWQEFSRRTAQQRAELRSLLHRLKGEGRTIAAYGAPAKGNTLLNYCGISTDLIAYTVDRNPLKVGKLTPGMHLPVRHVDTLVAEQPDYVVILAWNFADEIMEQQAAYHAAGGRFIIPIPTPRIV